MLCGLTAMLGFHPHRRCWQLHHCCPLGLRATAPCDTLRPGRRTEDTASISPLPELVTCAPSLVRMAQWLAVSRQYPIAWHAVCLHAGTLGSPWTLKQPWLLRWSSAGRTAMKITQLIATAPGCPSSAYAWHKQSSQGALRASSSNRVCGDCLQHAPGLETPARRRLHSEKSVAPTLQLQCYPEGIMSQILQLKGLTGRSKQRPPSPRPMGKMYTCSCSAQSAAHWQASTMAGSITRPLTIPRYR